MFPKTRPNQLLYGKYGLYTYTKSINLTFIYQLNSSSLYVYLLHLSESYNQLKPTIFFFGVLE